MKKVLSTILVLALVLTCGLTILTACEKPVDYAHTIVLYTAINNAKSTAQVQAAIAKFEEANPGWKVEQSSPQGSSYSKLHDQVKQQIGSGIYPDIVHCYADHVSVYMQSNIVVDLAKYMAPTTEIKAANGAVASWSVKECEDFVETFMGDCLASSFDLSSNPKDSTITANSLVQIPFVKSTEVMFCNKTAIDELKTEYNKTHSDGLFDTYAATWDQLWAQAAYIRELGELGKTNTAYAKWTRVTPMAYDSAENWFITMMEQNKGADWGFYTDVSKTGAARFGFANETVAQWLATLNDYYNKGYFTTNKQLGDYVSTFFAGGVGAENGSCIYGIGSSAGAQYYHNDNSNFDVEMVAVPGSVVGDEVVSKQIFQGPSFTVLKGSQKITGEEWDEKEKMIMVFLKYLYTADFQAQYAVDSGYMPAVKSAADTTIYKNAVSAANATLMVKAMSLAYSLQDTFFTSAVFAESAKTRTLCGTLLNTAIATSGYTATTALTGLQQVITDAIGTAK